MEEGAQPPQAAAGKMPARDVRRKLKLGGALAAVIVAAVVAGLVISGTWPGPRITVGAGVTSEVADQTKSDFPDDQAAYLRALHENDPSAASGKVTGNSLQELEQQIADNRTRGVRQRIAVNATSTEILAEGDPNDAGVTVEVHQVGTEHQDTLGLSGEVPASSQDFLFDNRYWLRQVGGRYAITDIQKAAVPVESTGPWPWLLLVLGVAFVLVMLAALALRFSKLGTRGAVAAPSVSGDARAMPGPSEAPLAWIGPGDMTGATLGVRTIGGFQLWWQGEDLAPAILSRRTTGFLGVRLLVAAIENPAAQLARDDAREELFPRVDPKSQQGRLRQLIQEFKALPPVLRDRMVVSRLVLSFDLEGCAVDAMEILKLGRELRAGAVVDPTRLAYALSVLESVSGRFLPGWKDALEKATDVDSPATEMVEELCQRIDIARADILVAIGDDLMRRHEPDPAIEVFQDALRLRGEREDIAARLGSALLSAGRQGEAERVSRDYS